MQVDAIEFDKSSASNACGLGGGVSFQRETPSTDRGGQATWPEGPVFTTETGQSFRSDVAADGSGGALVAWMTGQEEGVAYGKVFSQRMNADGKHLWGEAGAAVFPGPDLRYQGRPHVVRDGLDGAIVVAAVGKGALRGDMIYAQRLDAAGNRLWGDGVRIDE